MSGGNFNNIEFRLNYDTVDELDYIINSGECDNATVLRLKDIKSRVKLIAELLHQVDYLVGGDYSEQTFCNNYDKIIRGE